jgi:hypothetical protein
VLDLKVSGSIPANGMAVCIDTLGAEGAPHAMEGEAGGSGNKAHRGANGGAIS